jgi:hypothetical protein
MIPSSQRTTYLKRRQEVKEGRSGRRNKSKHTPRKGVVKG